MFVLYLVVLALLASSTARSGLPQDIQSQWLITDENPQYEDIDGRYLTEKERVWLDGPTEVIEVVTVDDQNMPTSPVPYDMKEQGPGEGAHPAVWKIVLVVVVLLVSIVGSLSVAYYMCVWRGGRIHYQPQKGNNV